MIRIRCRNGVQPNVWNTFFVRDAVCFYSRQEREAIGAGRGADSIRRQDNQLNSKPKPLYSSGSKDNAILFGAHSAAHLSFWNDRRIT
jgi:hypothetical protein